MNGALGATPAPWHVDTWRGVITGEVAPGLAHHAGVHEAVWAGDLLFCPTGLVGTPESRQNAVAIAATPELFHALNTLLVAVTTDSGMGPQCDAAYLQMVAIPRARAALAKAMAP